MLTVQNPKNYREYLLPRMEKWADRVMFDAPKADPNPNNERESVTYGEVLQQAYTLAAWLRERGAGVGTRVAIVGFNAIQWGVSFVAIHLIGAAPVIVNAATSVESLVHCLSLVKPHTVLADSITAGLLYPVEDKLKAAGVGEVSAAPCSAVLGQKRSSLIPWSVPGPPRRSPLSYDIRLDSWQITDPSLSSCASRAFGASTDVVLDPAGRV